MDRCGLLVVLMYIAADLFAICNNCMFRPIVNKPALEDAEAVRAAVQPSTVTMRPAGSRKCAGRFESGPESGAGLNAPGSGII